MSEEAADIAAVESSDVAAVESVLPEAETKKTEVTDEQPEASSSNNFYSFFNKVDTFISSTAQQLQSQIPPIDGKFLEKEKESINKNIQKNFFKFNEKLKTTNVVVSEDFQSTKLPDSYIKLEKQTDDLGKVLKKIIDILQTYEVEGYDYPPSLSDGLNEVWKVTNKFKLWGTSKEEAEEQEAKYKDDQGFLPRSFAQALANTFSSCHQTLSSGHKESQSDEDGQENGDLLKILSTLKDANTIIDEQKENQDNLIKSEILPSLSKLYNETYKSLKTKRNQVESLRIELDSLRYTNENNDDSLEDQFINQTTLTLNDMESFVDSVDLIALLKSYNQIQLNYYKKCVEEYEKSLSVIQAIEDEYDTE